MTSKSSDYIQRWLRPVAQHQKPTFTTVNVVMVLCKFSSLIQPCGFGWSRKRKWKKLSKTWNLPNSRKRALFEVCDRKSPCKASQQGLGQSLYTPRSIDQGLG